MMFANFRSLLRVVAVFVVVSASGCEGDTSVLLTVKGEPSRVAALSGRIIGSTGPVGPVHRFSNGEVVLPGTVLIQTSASTSRLGIVLWAEDASGKIVSQARSGVCFEVVSGSQSKYQITMMPAQAGWSPAIADQCYCNEKMPGSDMCPPGGIPDDIKNQQGGTSGTGTGGKGGGTGATGGAGGSSGGSGGTVGGVGGSATGGSGGIPVAGGTGGTATGGTGGTATGGTGGTATGGAGGTVVTGGMGGTATGGTGVPATNSLFSFDTAADWSMDGGTVSGDTAIKSQGTGSISFTVATKTFIRSRAFATSEVPGATSKISLDVYFETAQGNQSNIQMWFECVAANVFNAYVEYKSVGGTAAKTWTPVVFTMPAPVAAALKGNFSGCKLWMDFEASGLVRFDNLGFVP
jgi:hypothetical protein